MKTKAFMLMVAAGLATGPGALKAQELDALAPAIDLPSIADLILDELLGEEDSPFVLAIGFSFGLSFASDDIVLADTFSEGLVASQGGSGGGVVDALGESFVTPGFAATTTGVNTAVINLTPPVTLAPTGVSQD